MFQLHTRQGVRSVSGKWLGHDVTFSPVARGNLWYALAGISLETPPGTYPLKISQIIAQGNAVTTLQQIRIERGIYPKITIKVAKQFTAPSAEQLREVHEDKGVKQKAFGAVTPERLWTGSFVAPVSAAISDVFGTARVFNGEVKSRHQGLDYGVPAGTAVSAVNRGTVILARPLFFEGNCVVLDHGQGLLSLYLHLSEFKVKEGDQVESGQLLGLSGGSGRATGPHLHLAIRWQGLYLNPATLLKIKLPAE